MLENDTYEIQNDYQQSLVDKYIPLKSGSEDYDTCSIRTFGNSSDGNSSTTGACRDYVYSKQYYTNTLVTSVRILSKLVHIKCL